MIKHRFILPTSDDFKIFAAIPCENTVLVWEKWTQPPDWEKAEHVTERALQQTVAARDAFEKFRTQAAYGQGALTDIGKDTSTRRQVHQQFTEHIAWANQAIEASTKNSVLLTEFLMMVRGVRVESGNTGVPELFTKAVVTLRDTLAVNVDPTGSIPYLLRTYESDLQKAYRTPTPAMLTVYNHVITLLQDFIKSLNAIKNAVEARERCVDDLQGLISHEPLPDTPCPPGVPFAAYTVEWGDTVVAVVEGKAWFSSGHSLKTENDARAAALQSGLTLEQVRAGFVAQVDRHAATTLVEEKRVVEIVTQMLTERSLNPKADTRVPVREIDPKHAHQTREAEQRDPTPRVRTIKFQVTPPRYLREAAEKILSSPRRAHWVIGHWRNQPWGEKRQQHRQTWIKPHIRGLGEASATVAAVVAPRPVS